VTFSIRHALRSDCGRFSDRTLEGGEEVLAARLAQVDHLGAACRDEGYAGDANTLQD